MFKPSKEDAEKYGMNGIDRMFEIAALAMVALILVGFFLKILFF